MSERTKRRQAEREAKRQKNLGPNYLGHLTESPEVEGSHGPAFYSLIRRVRAMDRDSTYKDHPLYRKKVK